MNPKLLKTFLKKWQKSLGLESWKITICLVDPWKVDDDSTARSFIDPFHMRARIEIVNPEHVDPDAPHWESMEVLILHELLHCRLFPDGVTEGSAANLALEQGINIIARLLVGE